MLSALLQTCMWTEKLDKIKGKNTVQCYKQWRKSGQKMLPMGRKTLTKP